MRSSSLLFSAAVCGLTSTRGCDHSGEDSGSGSTFEDVEGGERHTSVVEGPGKQRHLVDDGSAPDTGDDDPRLDGGKHVGADEVMGLLGPGQGDHDRVDVGDRVDEFVERHEAVHTLDRGTGARGPTRAHRARGNAARTPRRRPRPTTSTVSSSIWRIPPGSIGPRTRGLVGGQPRQVLRPGEPNTANSASGPPWTPALVVNTIRSRASASRFAALT